MIRLVANRLLNWKSTADERSTMTAGCMLAIGSALVTSLMLFINGSLVMAIVSAVQRTSPSWAGSVQLSQFLLFTVPVLFVILEWMMIDYVRTRIRHRRFRNPTREQISEPKT